MYKNSKFYINVLQVNQFTCEMHKNNLPVTWITCIDQSCHKNKYYSKLQPSGTYIQTVVSINVPGIHLT